MTREAVTARPAVSQAEGQPRMQKTEQELKDTIMEDSTQEAISERNRPKAITMSQTESPATDLNDRRLGQAYHSKLLKVFISPDVVVSLKEIHFDPTIHQITQGREHLDISLRDDVAILVPEIPDISQ